jgi:hypothetical protein
MGPGVIPYSQFLRPCTDGRHRFEIGRLFASLNLVQLVTRIVPRLLGEIAQHLSESPRKRMGFIR